MFYVNEQIYQVSHYHHWELNLLFRTFADLMNRVIAWPTTDWLVAISQYFHAEMPRNTLLFINSKIEHDICCIRLQ